MNLKRSFLLLSLLLFCGCVKQPSPEACPADTPSPCALSELEIVAELPVNPGNVTVCPSGQVFATVHQFRKAPVRLIEITGKKSYRPFPNAEWNDDFGSDDKVLNSPLGIQCDSRGWLWVIDNGSGKVNQIPKLVAFDSQTGEEEFYLPFSSEIAPKGSFVQDLAVDPDGGFVYLADIGGAHKPALVFVDTNEMKARRFEHSTTLASEDVDLVVEGKRLLAPGESVGGNPARVAVNPITLSEDNKTLYFGAMTGTKWYSIPARLFQQASSDQEIASAITLVGKKPVSDGASTDILGNHFFTDVNENAISVLSSSGRSHPIIQDERLVWPDALAFGEDGWLYIAVNQLNRAAPFNGGIEKGNPPYFIARVRVNTTGVVGR